MYKTYYLLYIQIYNIILESNYFVIHFITKIRRFKVMK